MCVIYLVDGKRPSPDMVRAGYEENSHGAGVAWQEDGFVKWRKGLEVEEMLELSASLPLPHIQHYRIASIGGIRPELTHPFTVDGEASLELEGQTDGSVLFHNGTWLKWRETVLDFAARHNLPLPAGKWSDTRAMAWMAGHLGMGFLELLDEGKVVIMTPDDVMTFGSWSHENDVWCSNTWWKRKLPTSGRSLPATHQITGAGGNPSSSGTRTEGSGNVAQGTTGTKTLGPYHHTGHSDCSCNDCVAERVSDRLAAAEARREGAEVAEVPFVEGSDSERVSSLQESGARIQEAKQMLDSMSKNALKRLRKRKLYHPTMLSQLEHRVLSLDAFRQRKNDERKHGGQVH